MPLILAIAATGIILFVLIWRGGGQGDEKLPQVDASGQSWLKVRLRGLLLMCVGVVLTPIVAYLCVRLPKQIFDAPVRETAVFVALPVVLTFLGWLEFLTGVSFLRLSHRFDTGRPSVRLGLALFVFASVIAFITLIILICNLASSWGWL
jgi:hypothetical protein